MQAPDPAFIAAGAMPLFGGTAPDGARPGRHADARRRARPPLRCGAPPAPGDTHYLAALGLPSHCYHPLLSWSARRTLRCIPFPQQLW